MRFPLGCGEGQAEGSPRGHPLTHGWGGGANERVTVVGQTQRLSPSLKRRHQRRERRGRGSLWGGAAGVRRRRSGTCWGEGAGGGGPKGVWHRALSLSLYLSLSPCLQAKKTRTPGGKERLHKGQGASGGNPLTPPHGGRGPGHEEAGVHGVHVPRRRPQPQRLVPLLRREEGERGEGGRPVFPPNRGGADPNPRVPIQCRTKHKHTNPHKKTIYKVGWATGRARGAHSVGGDGGVRVDAPQGAPPGRQVAYHPWRDPD